MKYLLILAIIGLVLVSGCIQQETETKVCPGGSNPQRDQYNNYICTISCETASDCAAGIPIIYGSDVAVLSCYNKENVRESPPTQQEPPECGCVNNRCVEVSQGF